MIDSGNGEEGRKGEEMVVWGGKKSKSLLASSSISTKDTKHYNFLSFNAASLKALEKGFFFYNFLISYIVKDILIMNMKA